MRYFESKNKKSSDDSSAEIYGNMMDVSSMEDSSEMPGVSDNFDNYDNFDNQERIVNYPMQTLPSNQPVLDFNQANIQIPSVPSYTTGVIGPIIIPIGPGSIGYAQVRFLHAVAGGAPVMISVGPTVFTSRLAYENITSYGRIASGYRTITVVNADNPSDVLLRKSVTFTAGSQMTIALVNSATGIQLLTISDTLCSNKSWNSSCIRFVNLSYGSGSLNVQLDTGMSVFEDIDFMEITPFKQIGSGTYYFNVYQSSPGIQPRNISGEMGIARYTSFELQAGSNEMYTIYLVGSTFTSPTLQAVIVTNV